jgi:hypothetical protein
MSTPTKREAAVAYHEAGHAVIGFWAEVPRRLMEVSLVPDLEAGTLGHVRRGRRARVRDIRRGEDGTPRSFLRSFDPDLDDQPLVERRLRPEIIARFAGVLAEKRFRGRGHNWAGASTDMVEADSYIGAITGSPRQAEKYAAFLWVVAEEAVATHWSDIDRLAQELLGRKRMTGRETEAFLWALREDV